MLNYQRVIFDNKNGPCSGFHVVLLLKVPGHLRDCYHFLGAQRILATNQGLLKRQASFLDHPMWKRLEYFTTVRPKLPQILVECVGKFSIQRLGGIL